jgi:NAD(P)-dependent dehydrogenase (short-subunit alcohol dehydrogenase family)
MNIVITGASSGIGFQTVLHLLKDEVHTVIAIARSSEKLLNLTKQASKNQLLPKLITLPFNIINGDYANNLVPFINNNLGKVDVLINNAGELLCKTFAETSIEDVEQMLQSNYVGHVKMIHAILPLINTNGHIVNIGSMGGYPGSTKFAGLSAYSSSKAALHVLTECLALELADSHIKVNCLALGSAQTEMLSVAFPGYQSPVSAEAMGSFIANFATTGHQFFNGKILPVSVTTP